MKKSDSQKLNDLLIRCKNRHVSIINKRNGNRLAESTLRHRCTNANADKYQGKAFYGEEPPSPSPLKNKKYSLKLKSPSPSPKSLSPSPKSLSPKFRSSSPSPRAIILPGNSIDPILYSYDHNFLANYKIPIEINSESLPDQIIIRKAGKSPERLDLPNYINAKDLSKKDLNQGQKKVFSVAKKHPDKAFGKFK